MKNPNPNITQIRTTLGTGPVRHEKPATVKKRAAMGPKEAALRALREAQTSNHRQP